MNDTERVWEVTTTDQLAHALSAVVLRAANKNLNTCRGQVYINSYRPLNDHLAQRKLENFSKKVLTNRGRKTIIVVQLA